MFRLTPPKPRLSEADVIKDCVRILRKRGYWVQRNPVGKFRTLSGNLVEFGPVGIPDYTAIHATYPAVFVEFKRPGKILRETQRTKFADVQILFGLAAVMVDSSEDLVAFLDGHEARSQKRSAPRVEALEVVRQELEAPGVDSVYRPYVRQPSKQEIESDSTNSPQISHTSE